MINKKYDTVNLDWRLLMTPRINIIKNVVLSLNKDFVISTKQLFLFCQGSGYDRTKRTFMRDLYRLRENKFICRNRYNDRTKGNRVKWYMK